MPSKDIVFKESPFTDVPRAGGGTGGEFVFSGDSVAAWEDEKVLHAGVNVLSALSCALFSLRVEGGTGWATPVGVFFNQEGYLRGLP